MERATLIALSLVCVLLLIESIASLIACNWWWALCQMGMLVIALYAVHAQVEEIREGER